MKRPISSTTPPRPLTLVRRTVRVLASGALAGVHGGTALAAPRTLSALCETVLPRR
jgi:hypothetical protein